VDTIQILSKGGKMDGFAGEMAGFALCIPMLFKNARFLNNSKFHISRVLEV
jgi:hypothetical protein